MSFSVISQNFLFLGGFPKFPFLTTWPTKRAPPKHYKNRGFGKFFFGKTYASRKPFLDQKKPKSRIPVINFRGPLSLSTTKKHKNIAETPVFIVFQRTSKGEFSKNKHKTEKAEKPNFCTLFLKKATFKKITR